ncbi:MAG: hypothetical protein Q7S66_02795 [bacterium]|nr:hypothetical protein [bacterium]
MKKILFYIAGIIILILGVWALLHGVSWYRGIQAKRAQAETIDNIIKARQVANTTSDNATDPFGEDGIVRILLIGLDKRAGQVDGNCDLIQLATIDKTKQSVVITAVPRGTYSPLPLGKGATSSDYYVSNACGLGGLEYGIKQIEKILGERADYVVVVGFSQTLGILRNLKLPTTQTLQWLRERHVYAIGEPQRARDHSTFLKYLLTKFVPTDISPADEATQYIMYKTVQTDLSFSETKTLVTTLSAMDLANHPERVLLSMRPAHSVQDIQYIPENLGAYLDATVGPLSNVLSKNDYSGDSTAETQTQLLKIMADKKSDPDFIVWAWQNNLWLQIEDDQTRLSVQFDFLSSYLPLVSTTAERQSIISDYILEMENRGESRWQELGRGLLSKEI